MDRDPRVEGPAAVVAADNILAWSTVGDIPGVVFNRVNLKRTVSVALVVGSVLFAINQLDVVMSGSATTTTWVKACQPSWFRSS